MMVKTRKGKFFWYGGILGATLLCQGYLASLEFKGLPLYAADPAANLPLRFLSMDLLPLLWAAALLGDRFHGWRNFRGTLRANAVTAPLTLTVPILAAVLFFHESLAAAAKPDLAGPVSPVNVLWMQGATALMAALLFDAGNRPAGKRDFPWVSWILSILLGVGGLAFFLATHCDISRLLILLGGAAWAAQKGLAVKPALR